MKSEIGNERPSLGLRMSIPLILAVLLIAEIALRAVPIERFAFRSTEALHVPHVPGVSAAPLLPERHYSNNRTYGDLSALANLRRLRQYRREVFTTDRFGYRNAFLPSKALPPVAMLVGDSFGVGAGNEDSETLPAQLTRLWGRDVYNASEMTPTADLIQIRLLTHALGMRGGLLIYEYLERQGLPSVPVARALRRHPTSSDLSARAGATEVLRSAWALSRLRIIANRMYRFFQDDRFLPNPYAGNAMGRRLANGKEMLFLPPEPDRGGAARPVDPSYFVWLQREILAEDLRLLVLLVPDKYPVYEPLLAEGSANKVGDDYLDRLERALSAAGVPVVNLRHVFQTDAARGLPKGSYLYWLDDTHWNAEGMRVAAEEINQSAGAEARRESR